MSEEFEVTEEQFLFANDFATWVTVPGTIVCGLVLIAYGLIAVFAKNARRYLDRVSFRLLTYSLFFNIIFGIDYALTPAEPGRGCLVGAFFNNVTLCLSTFFTACIAINLQLVLVHKRNGKELEKYYIVGTAILTILLNVPTVADGEFGWNDDTATCWYSNVDSRTRLSWIIGTSSFWIALAATVETICSAVVLIWLSRHVRAIQKLKSSSKTIVADDSSPKTEKDVEAAEAKAESAHDRPVPLTDSDSLPFIFLDPRFRNIIIRIALYPIISLIMNYTTVILDLYISVVNVVTQKDYRILVADLAFYGLRVFVYGLLAATDPSFIKAVKVVFGRVGGGSTSDTADTSADLTDETKTGGKKTNKSTTGTLFNQSADWEKQTHEVNEEQKRSVEKQL